MPPVLVDSILVDEFGNPFVDGSGNPIIILAGQDPADCSCCGVDKCVTIEMYTEGCGGSPATLTYTMAGSPSPAPEVGKFYMKDGSCFQVISVESPGCPESPTWFAVDAGPFDDCATCQGGTYGCITATDCETSEPYLFSFVVGSTPPTVGGVYKTDTLTSVGVCVTVTEVVETPCPSSSVPWAPIDGPFEDCEDCAPPPPEFLEYTIDYYDTFTCDYIGTDTITVTAAEAWFVGNWIGFSSGPHMYHKAQILSYDGLSAVTPDSTTFGDTSC